MAILSLSKTEGSESVILKPPYAADPGYYEDTVLSFYYVDYPEIKMDVQILAEVEDCVPENADFADLELFRSY